MLIYPTETVWGLGVDALKKEALELLSTFKKKDKNKPLSILMRSLAEAKKIAFLSSSVEKLIQVFSPGPLTFVLPLKDKSLMHLCGGRDFIGLRFSSHPFVIRLVWSYPHPIVTTSANASGEKELFSAQDLKRHSKDVLAVEVHSKLHKGPGPSELSQSPRMASAVIQIEGKKLTFLRRGLLDFHFFSKVAQSLGFESKVVGEMAKA